MAFLPVTSALKLFAEGKDGATLIEYALIVALMVLVVAVSVGSLGQAVLTMYTEIAGAPY